MVSVQVSVCAITTLLHTLPRYILREIKMQKIKMHKNKLHQYLNKHQTNGNTKMNDETIKNACNDPSTWTRQISNEINHNKNINKEVQNIIKETMIVNSQNRQRLIVKRK
jgi:hypothetical protein